MLGQHLLLELRLRLLLLGRLRRRRRLLLLQRVLVRGGALRPGQLLTGTGWQRVQLGGDPPRLLLPLLLAAWAGRLGLLAVGCLQQQELWLPRHCWLAQRGGLLLRHPAGWPGAGQPADCRAQRLLDRS